MRQLFTGRLQRVRAGARLMEPYRRRQFHAFGRGSIVHRPLWLFGTHHMALGREVLVLPGCWLSVETPAWERSAPALTLGDRVGIRPYVTISATERVTIEDDVIIAAYSSIIDSDHTYALGRPNVMDNPAASAPIHIGRGTWIAERVGVLRGARIGRCCIIGANSVVRGEIPDFSIAVGAPARVVGEVEGIDEAAFAP